MASPSGLPENVLLLPSASNDLARLLKKDRQEVVRILDDLKRLGMGTLPPQGKKKLRGIEAFQFDSGRYRVVYSRRDVSYVIWAVFAKPDQKNVLKRFL